MGLRDSYAHNQALCVGSSSACLYPSRLTRTGREYEGTLFVESCTDLATQLAK